MATNLSHFSNHLNEEANKCFVGISSTELRGEVVWNYKVVSDAFEGTVYASYAWHSDDLKKYWEVPPVKCAVMALNRQSQACGSEDEFDETVFTNFGLDMR